MLSENAKDVPGFEGVYAVTEDGRVYSHSRIIKTCRGSEQLRKGRWLKPRPIKTGYLRANLYCGDGTAIDRYIHRLVAESFLSNPLNLPEVNHKDGDKTNNHVSNLEWVSSSDNKRHAHSMGLNKAPSFPGESHPSSKLTAEQVVQIRGMTGKSYREISLMFGVSSKLIGLIIRRKAWRHI